MNLLAEDKFRRELFGPLGEVCAGLRTVDPIQPDSCLFLAVVDGDRVSVRDANNLGVECLNERARTNPNESDGCKAHRRVSLWVAFIRKRWAFQVWSGESALTAFVLANRLIAE